MVELVGYRAEYAGLCAQVWRGGLLLSVGGPRPCPAAAFAPAPPRPDERALWCRVLVAPGLGMVVLDDIDPVHRSARLSIATLAEPAGLLDAAITVAGDRLRLHRLSGVLREDDRDGAEIVAGHGFTAEVTIPRHLWLNGAPHAGTIWGRCADVG